MAGEPATDQEDLEEFSSAELLEFMATKDAMGRAAFAVFYKRHLSYLLGACRGLTAIGSPGWTADVAQEALLRAYEKASTFRLPKDKTPDQGERFVRAWLGTIARRLATDLLGQRRGPNLVLEGDAFWENREAIAVEEAPSAPNALLDRIMEVIETLSDSEQLVLRTTLEHYDADGTARKLPSIVIEGLAKQLRMTSASIRQVRHRAFEKVKRQMQPATVTSIQRGAK